jgi:hypothetical protein
MLTERQRLLIAANTASGKGVLIIGLGIKNYH